MFRKKSPQASIFDVGNVWPLKLDPDSYYGQLAAVSERLFRDEEFSEFYKNSGRGRPCVPPSKLALVMLMQFYEQLSDEKAIDNTAYNLLWAAVLRRCAGEKLCAKATLQTFRAQIIIHERLQWLLKKSIEEAKNQGLITNKELIVATDTKPILGRGAVKDTINLIADAMLTLARAQAALNGEDLAQFLTNNGFERLIAPSIKGSVQIDWSDKGQQDAFLTELVADARRLLELVEGCDPGIKQAASLLEQIILQDVSEKPRNGCRADASTTQDQSGSKPSDTKSASIKEGTASGRIPSVTDPEQRHGRKSKSNLFVGSKAALVADAPTGLILSVDVIPGDAGDATGSVGLVEQAQANVEIPIETVLGDCAYGSVKTRQEFDRSGHRLVAKVPKQANTETFPKGDFTIDLPGPDQSLEMTRVTCPAGHLATRLNLHKDGGVTFYFDEFCTGCPLRERCTKSAHGRSLYVHPEERMIQAAREFQKTPEGHALIRKRLIAENALARVGNLGIGQARYIGIAKTKFQVTIAAVVANLRLAWNYAGRCARAA